MSSRSYIMNQNQTEIKFIFETHFHADFVSGHLTLSKLTGAPIIFGPNSKTSYKSEIGNDNQERNYYNSIYKILSSEDSRNKFLNGLKATPSLLPISII